MCDVLAAPRTLPPLNAADLRHHLGADDESTTVEFASGRTYAAGNSKGVKKGEYLAVTAVPPSKDTDDDQDADEERGDDDADPFDPYQHGNPKNATSFWGTVMHMLLVGISPTLLSLPSTFAQVGYAVGVCGSLATIALYTHCMHMIVASEYALCKRTRRQHMSYLQVVRCAFATGPALLRWMAAYAECLLYAVLVSIWAGGNAIYVLMISENLRSALRYFCVLGDDWPLDDRTVIAYLVVPLVLLCWIPNLKLLVVCSAFANVVNVFSIVVVLYEVMGDTPPLAARQPVGDPAHIPYFLGVIFVTVNGTGLLMSLKNQMRRPSQFQSPAGVLNVSYTITGLLYGGFGFAGYVKYGANVRDNVILNLPEKAFANMVKLLFAVAVLLFYPLCTYVTFDLLWNETLKHRLQADDGKRRWPRMVIAYAVRTGCALFSIGLAYLLPDISIFVSFTGTVCTSVDSVVLPAVVDWLVASGDVSERGVGLARVVKNIAIIGVGVVCAVAGLMDSISSLGDPN